MTDKEKKNDKLVTVAIHTYQKAQIVKGILESEGIEAYIHNVNQLQPMVSAGVRVRINEVDLPRALDIIENITFEQVEEEGKPVKEKKREILVPVDFSEYTLKTCEFAFELANEINCSVKLMHVYFSSFYPASIPFGDTFAVQPKAEGMYKDIYEDVERQMKELIGKLKVKIADGSIPNIHYSYILREGLPEEEVVDYSKRINPYAIVMGTQGSHKKDQDLIGSVTAEVIEACRTPIFAIPEKSPIHSISKLTGLKNYFEEHYPKTETDYIVVDGNEGILEALEKFVNENTIDMISLSSSPRNIFARMFNPGIAKRMLFHTNTPMLVLKSSTR